MPGSPDADPPFEPVIGPAALAGNARWPSWARFLYRLKNSSTIKAMSTSPAAPPTTPPAIVPAGATSSSSSLVSEAALVLVIPLEVDVAPSPEIPARPTPLDSSEESWVGDAEAVEKTVDSTVDRPLEMVMINSLADGLKILLPESLVEVAGMIAVWPSESDVVNGSFERVKVSMSPLDWVAKNKTFKSIDELESVACASVLEVDEA
jgi:hypothetical protein